MNIIGIDIGSLTTKAALINDGQYIDAILERSTYDFKKVGNSLFKKLLERNNLEKSDLDSIISTGYGRNSIPGLANDKVTEITAHAKGVQYFHPDVRSIIDIGGQDSKVIVISSRSGNVLDFQMNDKCAAGTGRFLEVMAEALEVDIDEFGPLALESKNPLTISSMCTVFAESEVISLFAQGKAKEDIAAGIHLAIAKRVAGMARRLSIGEPMFFCGGVAKNPAVKKCLEDVLEMDITVPELPQLTGAIGAALISYEKLQKNA